MAGNGVDLGHVVAMLEQVIVTQAEHAARFEAKIDALDRKFGTLDADVRSLSADVRGLTADVRGLPADVAGLRQAVADTHGSVMGHGIMLTEHGERLGRIEQHVGLPPH